MSINKMKSIQFPIPSYDDWEDIARFSLKGLPLEKLITKTIEGIELQPLYTEKDMVERLGQDISKSTTPIRNAVQQHKWIIAQQNYETDANAFVNELIQSLERGNEAIVYDGDRIIDWDQESLSKISELLTQFPIYIRNVDANHPFLKVFSIVSEEDRPNIRGAVSVPNWDVPNGYTNLRTLSADLWEAHHLGADAVTELAFALAKASEIVSNGTPIEELSKKFFIHFAVDTHFFMEIAKIRAFRILWEAFTSAFDGYQGSPIPIWTTTSLRSFSKLDSYVNLLRSGNSTFSSVLGGASIISVHPHDIITGPSASSVRYARNVQLVIREETTVDKVIDPSGGSYFIESLTNDLVMKAWSTFLEIEELGGMNTYIEKGYVKETLTKLLAKRKNDSATSKQSLVGTNVYADLAEPVSASWPGIQVENRLAGAFETMTSSFNQLQPKVSLLNFGELKDYKPRADFVTGYLATGGIQAIWSPSINNPNEAIEWIQKEKPQYMIICAQPNHTVDIMNELLPLLPKGIITDVAGKYDEAQANSWRDQGLNGFLFAGQNKIEKFTELHNRLKGAHSIEKA